MQRVCEIVHTVNTAIESVQYLKGPRATVLKSVGGEDIAFQLLPRLYCCQRLSRHFQSVANILPVFKLPSA